MKMINWFRTRKLWVKIMLPVLAVILVVVGFAGYKAWNLYQSARQALAQVQETGTIGTIDPEEVEQTIPEFKGDYLNLLIVGIDYDETDELRDYGSPEQANTDLLMYLHYNVKENRISVLQIPRDSCVGDITSNLRINKIFAEGENRENHIVNLAKYINDAFGLPVDNYIALDMAAFREIVDVFGGIDLYLPVDIYIYDQAGNATLFAPAGKVRMNGADAETVVRTRKQFGTQDLQRLVLQRYVYAAMYRMVASATMEDMVRHILPVVSYRVKSDLEVSTMISLCTKLLALDAKDIFFVRVPGGSVTMNGQSLYGVNTTNLAPILNEHFLIDGQPPLTPEQLDIPTGWEYPYGEILDEGGYLSDQLNEYEASAESTPKQDSSTDTDE